MIKLVRRLICRVFGHELDPYTYHSLEIGLYRRCLLCDLVLIFQPRCSWCDELYNAGLPLDGGVCPDCHYGDD
jgi:hypothetical protein